MIESVIQGRIYTKLQVKTRALLFIFLGYYNNCDNRSLYYWRLIFIKIQKPKNDVIQFFLLRAGSVCLMLGNNLLADLYRMTV